MKKFDIYKQGTRITFLEPTIEGMNMDLDKIVERIREVFALRLAWNPNLVFRCNGKRVYAPDWIAKHPEKSLVANGKTSNGKQFSASGNIYKDPRGMSTLKVIGRAGLKIMDYTFRNRDNPYRSCGGWAYCDKLQPATDRRSVIKDDVWNAFESAIITCMEEFPKTRFMEEEITDKEEKKTFEIFNNLTNKLFAPFLPKPIVIGGSDKKPKKTLQTGNLHPKTEDDIVAGTRPKKEPDPTRKIIERKKGWKRDVTNQKQVGLDGPDPVMRKGEPEDERKIKEPPLKWKDIHNINEVLFDIAVDHTPMIGLINYDNVLFADNYQGIKSEKEAVRRNKYEFAAIRIKLEQHKGKVQANLSLKEYRLMQERYAYEYSHCI
jgi:hypothetical protein